MENSKAINCLIRMQAQSAAPEDIEALNIAIDAVSHVKEIDTPKMIYKDKNGDYCPNCGKYLMYKDVRKCNWCGQSLMWDDREIMAQDVIFYDNACKECGGMSFIECGCPRCGYSWMNSYPPKIETPYCPSCGQKLNWPDWMKT